MRGRTGTSTSASVTHEPSRYALTALAGLTAMGGVAGAVQLALSLTTPPVDVLPFGLASWLLPALWLFASVGLPSGVACVLVGRRSPYGPTAAPVSYTHLTLPTTPYV